MSAAPARLSGKRAARSSVPIPAIIPTSCRRRPRGAPSARPWPGNTPSGELVVVSEFEVKEPKTREAVALLKAFKLESALLVDLHDNANLFLAVRNLPRVKAVDVSGLNIYDVLAHQRLVFSRRAFEAVLEKLK